jgi:hypothetical protein
MSLILATCCMLSTLSLSCGRALPSAVASITREANTRTEDAEDADDLKWISRMFKQKFTGLTAASGLCFERHSDIGRDIYGSLQRLPPPSGGGFTSEEMSSFPYAAQGHCKLLNFSLKLVPDDCELSDFEPLKLIELLRGHRLVFWGDSVTRQFFRYISLRLERCVPKIVFRPCLDRIIISFMTNKLRFSL